MRTYQQYRLCVCVIGRRPVEHLPESVTHTGAGGTDIGVRVMTVHAPRLKHTLCVAFVTRPSDMIDDVILSSGIERIPDSPGYVVQRLFPGQPFPFTATISPENGDFTGPTHLPLSTVAKLLPFFIVFPTFFGIQWITEPPIVWAMSVNPISIVPSSFSLIQTLNSIWYSKSSGNRQFFTSPMALLPC